MQNPLFYFHCPVDVLLHSCCMPSCLPCITDVTSHQLKSTCKLPWGVNICECGTPGAMPGTTLVNKPRLPETLV